MNNLQPLNLLTTANGSPRNDTGEPSNQQINKLQQTSVDQQTRQMALASLFSSLTNLANQQQQQIQTTATRLNSSHQQHFSRSDTFSHKPISSPQPASNQSLLGNQMQQPAFTPTTNPTQLSLSSSLQSVVAAAMMQQQLAVSVAATKNQPHQPATNVFLPSGINPRLDQMDVQLAANTSHLINQQIQQQQQQQPLQQRINYCTICNKELCNKYFMKTHMLKMHGINLEMEQPEDGSDSDETSDDRDQRNSNDQNDADSSNGLGKVQVKAEITDDSSQVNDCSTNDSDHAGSKKKSTTNRKLSISNRSSNQTALNNNKKTSSDSSSAITNNQNQKQATSVMNGFAGNSMGGVVCDICNKELCSKYFLKVHKQNTHGIMTDYQDPNQFIYPFAAAAAAAASNPFQPPALGQPSLVAPGSLPFPPNPFAGMFNAQQPTQQIEPMSPTKKPAKRARLSGGNKFNNTIDDQIADEGAEGFADGSVAGSKQQLESVYRLLLAKQQQQQTLGGQHCAMTQQSLLSFDPTVMPNATPTTAANPLNPLMCFGAMGPAIGPFGPVPGMSAAMVIDNILRNQHLFNRANQGNNQAQKLGQNNQDSKQQTSQGSKSATGKESSNNRYFSHYTEACPMCDRRFKSIKWLKTHMMNDHKQEIGAYMQMMMQYMFTGKSQQQMMFEQQQQQQQMTQHLLATSSTHQHASNLMANFSNYQPPQTVASNLLPLQTDHCHQQANTTPFQSNFQQHQQSGLRIVTTASSTSPATSNYESKPSKYRLQPSNALQESVGEPIDARFLSGRESLSPCNQSSSPLNHSLLNSANAFTGLSCLDIEHLNDSNNNNNQQSNNCYRLGSSELIRDSPPSWNGDERDDDLDLSSVGKHQSVDVDPGRHQQPQIKSND